jgi:hypothetical protein
MVASGVRREREGRRHPHVLVGWADFLGEPPFVCVNQNGETPGYLKGPNEIGSVVPGFWFAIEKKGRLKKAPNRLGVDTLKVLIGTTRT